MKTIYIWQEATELTDNFHPEGGCAAIADSLEEARRLLNRPLSDAMTKEPDFISDVACTLDRVFIFPDAGCC